MQTIDSGGTGPTNVVAGPGSRFIYLGPDISGAGLHYGMVYKDGIPDHLKPLFGECQAIRQAFVTTARCARAMIEYETGKGRQADIADEIRFYLEKKKMEAFKREFNQP